MAGPNYNIPQLFQKFFNIAGSYVPFHGVQYSTAPNDVDSPFFGTQSLSTPIEFTKINGVPIYEQITLTQKLKGGSGLVYTFPGWPLMEINIPSWIEKSEVTDHPGTIKEFMGDGDIEITIRGLLINRNSKDIPIDQMTNLYDVRYLKQALMVTSRVLNSLGIHYLVIENLRFPEVEGSLDVQPFVIDALSDYPYELVIKDAVSSKVLTPQQRARQLLLNK